MTDRGAAVTKQRVWRKCLHLPAPERRLLLEAFLLTLLVRGGLGLLGYRRLQALLAPLARPRRSPPLSLDRVSWAVLAVNARLPGSGTCLAQAMAAQILAGREGHPSQLRFGVARDPGAPLQAHAWLESRGEVVVGGAGLRHFTPLEDSRHP